MKKRNAYIWTMRMLMGMAAGITAALTLFLLMFVLVKGLPNISWELLSTKPSYLRGTVGILPDILNTLYMILTTLLFVLPLGVGAAVYLTEYAANKRLVGMIEYAAETLSGIPSIIYGLFGSLFFCQFMDLDKSLLAGAMTLVIMNLPTIMRTTQESLKTVPQSYREGAFGLGAGKWRVIRTVVLPNCVEGVITGCILSVGRIVGKGGATTAIQCSLQQIAVGIIGNALTVEIRQLVVGAVGKASIGRIGDIARRVVAEALLRENNVIQILDGSLGNAVQVIISITHLGRICKGFVHITKTEAVLKPPRGNLKIKFLKEMR